jgi:hypothetical protein
MAMVNEESLTCDRCKGQPAEGSLDDVSAHEDDEQDQPNGRRLSGGGRERE